MLEILYEDEHVIAVNKPHGLLVHRSPIATDVTEFALQKLREQIQRPVYPAHRLDRKTSGVLLFTLHKEMDTAIQTLFAEKMMNKTYLAVVRGYTDSEGTIDYPLKKENGQMQDAVTHYKTLEQYELPIAHGKFTSSRYSLVEVTPETGRMHQIRRHFAHIFHPIIADRPHGCNKQNRFWKDTFAMDTMMLHAKKLSFHHPISNKLIVIEASLQSEFNRVLDLLRSAALN